MSDPAALKDRSQKRAALMLTLCALLVFFTEATFRARKFSSSAPSVDAQVLLQLLVWGVAGLMGVLYGGLSPRRLRGPTLVAAAFLLLMLLSVTYSPTPKLTLVSSVGYCAFFAFALALQRRQNEGAMLKSVASGLALIVLTAPILFFAHKEPAETVVAGSNEGRIHGLAEHAAGL